MPREDIKSSAAIPLKADNEIYGVLSLNYRTPHHFTELEQASINLLANQIALILRTKGFGNADFVELISPNVLRIRMELPSSLKIDEYFHIVANSLWTIEFIYLVFALVHSGDSKAIKDFVTLFDKHSSGRTISKPEIRSLFVSTSIQPLVLVAAHYASPASFDLLGIGKVLEILRDTIKDLLWRGKHEKQMAELELQSKEEEITKLRFETEKVMTDIAREKLEIIEKASSLKLSEKDRKVIIAALLPQITTIASHSSLSVLKSGSVSSITKSKDVGEI